MPVSLSLAMIARNEEEVLGLVLSDASQFCDELVVVDTGSTDRTVEIARHWGARVEHFEWVDDFAAARNFSFESCTGDWIIWLDADDRVLPEVREGIRALKEELAGRADLDTVIMDYRIMWRDDDPTVCINHFPRERITRRSAGLRWENPIHELFQIDFSRALHRNDLYVEHRPPGDRDPRRGGRNLRILQRAYDRGDSSPRTLYYRALELKMLERFAEALPAYQEYVANPGPKWEHYIALIDLATCAMRVGREDLEVDSLLRAVQLDGSRPEAFTALGMYHFRYQRWLDAIPFFAAATSGTRPPEGPVNQDHYGWIPWDYLSVCLANSGRFDEAAQATIRALPGNPEQDRLIENLRWAASQQPRPG